MEVSLLLRKIEQLEQRLNEVEAENVAGGREVGLFVCVCIGPRGGEHEQSE